jgi:tRNA-dihydrouridine synthase A
MVAVLEAMSEYSDRHIARGGRLSHITRHMVGLFHGRPGARRFRQILSTDANIPGADSSVLRRAFAAVEPEPGAEAA